MVPAFAARVTPGNVEDDLDVVAEADWIVEAVFEDPNVKHELYAKLEGLRRPGTLVSSNTSGIPVAELVRGHSAEFARDFTITHFFNPPRTMELLEVVAGEATSPEVLERTGMRAALAYLRIGAAGVGRDVVEPRLADPPGGDDAPP